MRKKKSPSSRSSTNLPLILMTFSSGPRLEHYPQGLDTVMTRMQQHSWTMNIYKVQESKTQVKYLGAKWKGEPFLTWSSKESSFFFPSLAQQIQRSPSNWWDYSATDTLMQASQWHPSVRLPQRFLPLCGSQPTGCLIAPSTGPSGPLFV